MIIFNGAAFIQGILLAIFFGIIYLILSLFNIENSIWEIGNARTMALIFQSHLCAWICMIMASLGLNGRLFFIPTWILFTIACIFLCLNPELHWSKYIFITLSLIIPFAFFKLKRSFMKTAWTQSHEALTQLKKGNDTTQLEYWQLIQTAAIVPQYTFFITHLYWKAMYYGIYSGNDWLNHYKELLPLIGDRYTAFNQTQQRKYIKLNEAVINANDWEQYSHVTKSLGTLQLSIESVIKSVENIPPMQTSHHSNSQAQQVTPEKETGGNFDRL